MWKGWLKGVNAWRRDSLGAILEDGVRPCKGKPAPTVAARIHISQPLTSTVRVTCRKSWHCQPQLHGHLVQDLEKPKAKIQPELKNLRAWLCPGAKKVSQQISNNTGELPCTWLTPNPQSVKVAAVSPQPSKSHANFSCGKPQGGTVELGSEGDFGKCSSSLTRWPQHKGTTGLECVLGDGCSHQKGCS